MDMCKGKINGSGDGVAWIGKMVGSVHGMMDGSWRW